MFAVLVGAPGAGKGTQAKLLSTETGLAHASSGDLFREALEQGTELGREAERYMSQGGLAPDAVTVAMILQRLERPDARRGVLLDGFPRTLGQVFALDDALSTRDQRVDRVLYLNVPREVLLTRLGGRWICRRCQASFHEAFRPPAVAGRCDTCAGELYQRQDDRRETAERRLQTYFQQTLPVIRYYRDHGLLAEVDGDADPRRVCQAMLGALGIATESSRATALSADLPGPRRGIAVLDDLDKLARA